MRRLFWDTEAREAKDDDEEFKRYRQRAGIGMSLAYNAESDEWFWHDHNDLDELAALLESADQVVSYNGVGYDHIVLDADVARRVWIKDECDLWLLLRDQGARGWPQGSWGLGPTCERTFGLGKLGHGADAPTLLADGKIGKLATYLQRDVQLTFKLWDFIKRHGYVIDPEGRQMEVGLNGTES